MASENKRNGVDVRLLTAAGETFKPGDVVHVTFAGGAFAVNGGAVHTIEESGTVVTLFATTPDDLPQPRDVITYQISPADWERCLSLDKREHQHSPHAFRADSD